MALLKVAVVGLGTMGGRYAEALASGRYAGAELDSVCDVDGARAQGAALRYGVPGFASLAELLAARRPGAAYVATPDALHREPGVELAEAGVPLLIEKPLATTVADAEALAAAAERGGAPAEVNFSNRWNPPFVAARAAIESGQLGEVIGISARLNNVITSPRDRLPWAGETTPAWFLMSHCLDLAHWLGNCAARTAYAAGHKGVLAALGIDTYDSVQALLQYDRGVSGVFESTWVLPASHPSPIEFEFRVIGSHGALTVDTTQQLIRVESELLSYPQVLAWAGERFASFARNVRGEAAPRVPLAAGIENTRTLVAIHRSLQTGAVESV
ncbi:MAG TPA: Gfo/Idh/MocA family oxidoreductase [Dehalococcoidia bacterium]|nr:Gfo/Idh/MocA family oxidoreductase [Dehalococcoidia bacterium]